MSWITIIFYLINPDCCLMMVETSEIWQNFILT